MAITNNDLVKFGYGVAEKASIAAGHISFASDTRQLFVGDGEKAVAFAGNVANAVFADKKLTITYNDGTAAAVLDFSDVASAEGVSSLLGGLRKDVEANKTAISNLGTAVDTSIKALDASYKAADASIRADFAAADASLSERIAAFESGDNSVAKQIANAIDGLDSSANSDNDFFKLEVVEENGKVTGVNFTNKDIASASALAAVKDTADAAATQADFNDHKNNADIHVTKDQKDAWQAATDKVEAFFTDAVIDNADQLKDTLKEIQDYIASDASAAATMTGNITKAQETADQAVFDASIAQSEVDALEDVVTELTTTVGNNHTAALNAATTAESNAKSYADTKKAEAIADASADATSKANAAETAAKSYADQTFQVKGNYEAAGAAAAAEAAAKSYADAIKVNGQEQDDSQEITLTGVNITVGGTGSHKDNNIDAAIEDLYAEVQAASEAGVQSLAVNANSSNYAEVSGATGAVTLTIKKVALADASENNTGIADAWDVKESIRVAKEGAISAVQGEEGDASTAATVAGAKAYADAQIEAAALRWNLLQ